MQCWSLVDLLNVSRYNLYQPFRHDLCLGRLGHKNPPLVGFFMPLVKPYHLAITASARLRKAMMALAESPLISSL